MKRGGGSQKYPHSYLGGVIEMSMFVYEGGRGSQKSPKNRPRGLCMTPNTICRTYTIRILESIV